MYEEDLEVAFLFPVDETTTSPDINLVLTGYEQGEPQSCLARIVAGSANLRWVSMPRSPRSDPPMQKESAESMASVFAVVTLSSGFL